MIEELTRYFRLDVSQPPFSYALQRAPCLPSVAVDGSRPALPWLDYQG